MGAPSPSEVTAWNVPQMPSARWVEARLVGVWLSCWLQNETVYGYWVQFDPEAPFRRVQEVREKA